jgi:hypothetical protein
MSAVMKEISGLIRHFNSSINVVISLLSGLVIYRVFEEGVVGGMLPVFAVASTYDWFVQVLGFCVDGCEFGW